MQARMGSTRLPGKILKTIQGKTILEHDIDRCLRVKNAAGVIIATTIEPRDDAIIAVCRKYPRERVKCHRGSVEDVLDRYHGAAKKFGAQVVVRITSDCPLLDPGLVESMIDRFLSHSNENRIDYLCNNMPPGFPHGLDIEVFSFDALERAASEARDQPEREHVTPFIRNHPGLFRIENFPSETDRSKLRWTLDYPEDLEFISAVYRELYPVNPNFETRDILELLNKHPEIQALNENRRQR